MTRGPSTLQSVIMLVAALTTSCAAVYGGRPGDIPRDIRHKLAINAHPTPSQLGKGWAYMRAEPQLTSGERRFRHADGGYIIVKAVPEDNLPHAMRDFANGVDRLAAYRDQNRVTELRDVGDEAAIITNPRTPDRHTVYLRVRCVNARMEFRAPATLIPAVCRAYAKTMEANAQALLGERVAAPAPIKEDQGEPAAADDRMFKKNRRFASGSSTSAIRASHKAGELRLNGRGQLHAGEDCSLHVELATGAKPPDAYYRDRPYLGNAETVVRDLWGREVPMTALGERVVAAANEPAVKLKRIEPRGKVELELDLTGWWQLSRPGSYLIDVRWPIHNAEGERVDQVEARRFVFSVEAARDR